MRPKSRRPDVVIGTCSVVVACMPVEGTEGGAKFTRVLLGDELQLDVSRAREEVIASARRLVESRRDVGALVLECTNMPPCAADASHAPGLPVYGFHSLVWCSQAGLRPRSFDR